MKNYNNEINEKIKKQNHDILKYENQINAIKENMEFYKNDKEIDEKKLIKI